MQMLLFYYCQSTGKEVPSNSPITLELYAAIKLTQQTLINPKDFIGFIDSTDTTIQFYYEKSGKIWVEIPYPDKKGSYGKHISLSEIELFIQTLPKVFNQSSIPEGKFQAW